MGNERLIVPEPVIDVIAMQATAVPPPGAEEAAFMYQRANGVVERARTAEEVLKRCPVMGKLAIEAPDAADVMLALAASGNAIMAAEANQAAQNKPLEKQESEKSEPKPEVATVRPEQKHKTDQALPVPEATKHDTPSPQADPVALRQAEVVLEQTQHSEPRASEKDEVQAAPTDKSHDVQHVQPVVLLEAKAAQRETTNVHTISHEAVRVRPPDEDARQSWLHETDTVPLTVIAQQGIEHGTVTAEPSRSDPKVTAETIGIINADNSVGEAVYHRSDEVVVFATNASEAEAYTAGTGAELTDQVHDTVKSIEDEVPQPLVFDAEAVALDPVLQTEAETDEQLELLYATETLETYYRLTALNAEPKMDALMLPDITDVTTDHQLSSAPATETVPSTAFETFIAAQPVSEEPPTLAAIQEQANEQPLEQVFVQLAEHLSASTEEPGQSALWEILQDIEKALPACYVYQEETGIALKPHITPEMTEKLLALLRIVGYKDPKETLVGFVTTYDLAFLLQALEYMCQIDSEGSRKDLLVVSVAATSADDNDALLHLGRALFGLISRAHFEPSL